LRQIYLVSTRQQRTLTAEEQLIAAAAQQLHGRQVQLAEVKELKQQIADLQRRAVTHHGGLRSCQTRFL
jgi:uncharacterized protein involved in exopolysaccharide biosynthesis